MINRFLLTGDCHNEFSRFKDYDIEVQKDNNTAVIILGDAGLNWTLDEHDSQMKNFLSSRYNFRIYCVRGNHEARPQNIPDMKLVYDEDVQGEVYLQDRWPQIRYFKDWGIYTINGLKVGIVGGAYSVDKWYRLAKNYIWFEDEQLSTDEMIECTAELFNAEIDIMLSHTCPICWEPSDLFLYGIDQTSVDKSMELFLEEIAKIIDWRVWCFGHYHADRYERPGVEQFYKHTDSLDAIWRRWNQYQATNGDSLDKTELKSPMFYLKDELIAIKEDKIHE